MDFIAWVEQGLEKGKALNVVHMEVGEKYIDPVGRVTRIKIDAKNSGPGVQDKPPGTSYDFNAWCISPIGLTEIGRERVRAPCTVQLYFHKLCLSSQNMAMAPENCFDLPTIGMAVTEILLELPFLLLIQKDL
jgi:hypothetical protein